MLELRHVSKSFAGVRALSDVSLAFAPGEIHALMGENGAGKSTAIKILTGIHQPDESPETGTGIFIQEKPIRLEGPQDALSRGIGIVHQEIQVFADASIAENIMIDKLPTRGPGLIDWPALNAAAHRQMARVGLDLPPELPVRGLSAAQKQLIMIAKALASQVDFLFLDEPTSALTAYEAERLFVVLRELKAKGVAVIIVSHKLEEVFAVSDRVTVLRDGQYIGTHATADITPAQLIRWMVGRDCQEEHLGPLSPDRTHPALEARNIQKKNKAHNQSFALHRGEVLGFYGMVGSGRTELARLIIGEDEMESGQILLDGREIKPLSVGDTLEKYRLGYVTENRKEEGLFLHDSVRQNICVGIWQRLQNPFTRRIDAAAENQIASTLAREISIKTPSLDQPVGLLSGGNQQKVSIGKWIAADCDILIIDEPTIGVDVGSKDQIHRLIWNLARTKNKAIILISSDLPEICRLSCRILVFRDQSIVGEIKDIDTQPKTYQQVAEEIAPFFL